MYVTLADNGYFPKNWLRTFNRAGGKFGVHLQCDVPGVEVTSGSLGHGLGIGAGMALAARMDEKDYLTFVLLGDGECYEGSIWESAVFASHNKLNNLIGIIDRNYLCVTNFTESLARLEPMEDKWRAFGWETRRIDGNDVTQVVYSLQDIRSRRSSNPLMIIADTVKGKGIPFMENQIFWHGMAPLGAEADEAMKRLTQYCDCKEEECPIYKLDDLSKWECLKLRGKEYD